MPICRGSSSRGGAYRAGTRRFELTNAVQTASLSRERAPRRARARPMQANVVSTKWREEHVKHVSRKVIAVGLVAAVAALAVAVAVATAGTASKHASIQACGLMPDTKSSVRWEQFDK